MHKYGHLAICQVDVFPPQGKKSAKIPLNKDSRPVNFFYRIYLSPGWSQIVAEKQKTA
jgi:hypothetical protein